MQSRKMNTETTQTSYKDKGEKQTVPKRKGYYSLASFLSHSFFPSISSMYVCITTVVQSWTSSYIKKKIYIYVYSTNHLVFTKIIDKTKRIGERERERRKSRVWIQSGFRQRERGRELNCNYIKVGSAVPTAAKELLNRKRKDTAGQGRRDRFRGFSQKPGLRAEKKLIQTVRYQPNGLGFS